jgi:Holliday junction resolvase
MPAKNKARGNTFEYYIVRKAEEKGFTAKRAYGSDGRSFGESEKVDVMIDKERIQAKKRKCLPAYLKIDEGVDAVIFSTDRKPPQVLLRFEDYLELIALKGMTA